MNGQRVMRENIIGLGTAIAMAVRKGEESSSEIWVIG